MLIILRKKSEGLSSVQKLIEESYNS